MNKKFIYVLRRSTYWLLAIIDNILGNKNQAAILCFHSIDDGNWFFSNSLLQMETYLLELTKHYQIISLSEMLDAINKKQHYMSNILAITFDDGYKNLMSVAPLFKKYGIKPTVFALSDPDKANRKLLETDQEFLSDTDLVMLHHMFGWEVGSHSATHEDLHQLSDQGLKIQIIDSKKRLAKIIGTDIRYFAYPKGRHTDQILKHINKAGYKGAFTMDHEEIKLLGDVHRIPRVGINRTHGSKELIHSLSPSVIKLRRLISKFIKKTW